MLEAGEATSIVTAAPDITSTPSGSNHRILGVAIVPTTVAVQVMLYVSPATPVPEVVMATDTVTAGGGGVVMGGGGVVVGTVGEGGSTLYNGSTQTSYFP